MTKQFHELLLSELRMASYQPGHPEDMTDQLLCQAVTLDANLQSLGFALKPDDILRLSVSPSLEGFYDEVKALVPDVKAEPMYPGFPQQVMEMSEAEFRLHQMIHYFSTYGLESLLGTEVQKGWLPEYEVPERTQSDTRLLDAKVIDLVPEEEAPVRVLQALLNRRERLTAPELELVRECAPLCGADQLRDLKVRFKENLSLLFPMLMRLPDRKAALLTLRAVCAHSGDVFRCAADYLRQRRWHLTTSEKKLLVRLTESYSVGNLTQNMMQSLSLRERNLRILQHMDYNRFVRSPGHREAVRALRNGELMSWQGVGEALLRDHKPEALAHFVQRPGYMLRMINRLLSLSYSRDSILEAMLPAAGQISGHLVLKTLRMLKKRRSELKSRHEQAVLRCREQYRMEELGFCGFSYDHLLWDLETEVSDRRRAAYEEWERRREEAMDDAYRPANAMMKALTQKERELESWKKVLARIAENRRIRRHRLFHEDSVCLYAMIYWDDAQAMEEKARLAEEELADLRARWEQVKAPCDQRYDELTAQLEVWRAGQMKALDEWEQSRRDSLRQEFEEARRRIAQQRQTLPQRREADLARLEARYQAEIKASQYDDQAVEILKELLKEHFRLAQTPLQGKKVFLDLDAFDLDHSTLETEDRSKDGGYIRSGMAFRIPKKARIVRFFVYWNDPRRVDVDLHAGGLTLEGDQIHVGWNADFREGGVVHSGDVTHSDAAEYIDIDLSAPVREIYANVSLYSGKRSFKGIQTCYVGLMAVDKAHQDVKHYDPANCFFTHQLRQNTDNLFYGYIDVQDRFVRFIGQPNESGWGYWADRPAVEASESMFSLKDYLDCVLEAQGAVLTRDREEADAVLTMDKSTESNAVSLVDSNFFLEC